MSLEKNEVTSCSSSFSEQSSSEESHSQDSSSSSSSLAENKINSNSKISQNKKSQVQHRKKYRSPERPIKFQKLSREYTYPFENWDKTEDKDLLDCDKKYHFSSEWIQCLYDNVVLFNQKRNKLIEDNPFTNINELKIQWKDTDYVYPQKANGQARRLLRRQFETKDLKIDPLKKILINERKAFFGNDPIYELTGRVILDPHYLPALWTEMHINKAHPPVSTVLRNIRDFYWLWKAEPWCIERKKLCSCINNVKKKIKHVSLGRTALIIAPAPIEAGARFHIDLSVGYPTSKSGNTVMLHTVDAYSRYLILSPMRDKEPETVIYHLKRDVFRYFGVPSNIVADNGREFSNQDLHAISNAFDIKVFHPKPNRPQGNSYAEQSVAKWKRFARRMFVNAGISAERVSKVSRFPIDWDQYADWGMFNINQDVNSASDRLPQHLMINQGNRLRQYVINENAIRKQKQNKTKLLPTTLLSSLSSSSSSSSLPSSSNDDDDSSENKPILTNKPNINLSCEEKELANKMLFDSSQYEQCFDYSERNCFSQNANNPKVGKLSFMYSQDAQLMMQDKIFKTHGFSKKKQYKRSYDSKIKQFKNGTKVQYRKGKDTWIPKLFFHYLTFLPF